MGKLFTDYQGKINLNTILKETYNYDFDGDIKKLLAEPFIKIATVGVNALFWLEYKGEWYLFKPLEKPNIQVWGELLSQKIADVMDLGCAQYRAGALFDQAGHELFSGVLTQAFYKYDERLILGSELVQNFLYQATDYQNWENFKNLHHIVTDIKNPIIVTQIMASYLNNLEDVWLILENSPQIKKEDIAKIITTYKNMLLFDIITLQVDRHLNNWGLVFKGKDFQHIKMFDNTSSFGLTDGNIEERLNNFRNLFFAAKFNGKEKEIEDFIYHSYPNFSVSHDLNQLTSDGRIYKSGHIDQLSEFLDKSTKEEYLALKALINKLNPETIEKIITELEKENGLQMDDKTYFYISKLLEIHIKKINNLLDEYMEKYYGRKSL